MWMINELSFTICSFIIILITSKIKSQLTASSCILPSLIVLFSFTHMKIKDNCKRTSMPVFIYLCNLIHVGVVLHKETVSQTVSSSSNIHQQLYVDILMVFVSCTKLVLSSISVTYNLCRFNLEESYNSSILLSKIA